VAALVFIGIAVPPIDALLKPFVTEAIFGLLFIAFLRVDPASLRSKGGRGRSAAAITARDAANLFDCFSCIPIGRTHSERGGAHL
jgi:hypothetical protein